MISIVSALPIVQQDRNREKPVMSPNRYDNNDEVTKTNIYTMVYPMDSMHGSQYWFIIWNKNESG